MKTIIFMLIFLAANDVHAQKKSDFTEEINSKYIVSIDECERPKTPIKLMECHIKKLEDYRSKEQDSLSRSTSSKYVKYISESTIKHFYDNIHKSKVVYTLIVDGEKRKIMSAQDQARAVLEYLDLEHESDQRFAKLMDEYSKSITSSTDTYNLQLEQSIMQPQSVSPSGSMDCKPNSSYPSDGYHCDYQ